MCKNLQERDELRARFTVWMKVLAYRTRRKYLAVCAGQANHVSLESVPEEALISNGALADTSCEDSFGFEEKKLARAFSQLPKRKREILTMLFVLEQSPEDIAKELDCNIHNVYKHKSMAIKSLQKMLKEGEPRARLKNHKYRLFAHAGRVSMSKILEIRKYFLRFFP